jgi:hypothetical protein
MNAARVKAILRSLGPYVTLELIVPGGTMIALLLWLFRRSQTPTRQNIPDKGSTLLPRSSL